MADKDPLDTIETARAKFGPIYLCGSRRMHQIAGDVMWDNMMSFTPQPDTFGPSNEEIREMMTIPLRDDTDHDFYATYTQELNEFLCDNGFEHSLTSKATDIHDGYNLDEEAVVILQHDNVQIVLRRDAEFYRLVFDNIEPWFYKKYLWKSSGEATVDREQIQSIMNMLFAIGRAAQNTPTTSESPTCPTL